VTITRVSEGERRIPWYWAVAWLLPIGGLAIAVFFIPLLAWVRTQPPGSVIPPALVIGLGTAASLFAFGAWRFALLRWLRDCRPEQAKAEPGAAPDQAGM
jgi:membrane protein YdbS with pleckstrin-like domain